MDLLAAIGGDPRDVFFLCWLSGCITASITQILGAYVELLARAEFQSITCY